MASVATIQAAIFHYDKQITAKLMQIEFFMNILEGRDVIANLPVGNGKSLLFQGLPNVYRFCKTPEPITNCVVLVISPLNIIQADQCDVLNRHSVSNIRLPFNVDRSDERSDSVIQRLAGAQYQVVLTHLETLLNSSFGHRLLRNEDFTSRVIAVVIDECHIVEQWGEVFRTVFSTLKTLPAVFQAPFLAFSGTVTTDQLSRLPNVLGLQDPVVVQETPDKPNVYLGKVQKRQSRDSLEVYEQVFRHECDQLKEDPTSYPVTLMFMPLYYISQAAAYLRHLFSDVDITTSCYAVLYSRQDKGVIDTTMADLKSVNPRIRLILTSSVSGMGYDPPCVSREIHTKPPHNVPQYLQEIGTAGRRGQAACFILYYSNSDLAKNVQGMEQDIVQYCKANEKCLHEIILNVFGFTKNVDIPNDKCCTFCTENISEQSKSTGACAEMNEINLHRPR